MKRFITTLFLISLYVTIISNSVHAQLPFEPFAAYNGNPVLPATPGTWDEYATWWPNVIFVNDTFYIVYNGTDDLFNTPVSIGIATSSDGFTYTKDINPMLSGDGGGFDAYNTVDGVLFFSDPTWYLYYTGRSSAPNQPGDVIGRATSNISPHGPWTRSDDTLLAVGSLGEWDSGFIGVETIVENGTELIMYYFAGASFPNNAQIGMATSTDGGLTWEKYNDPTTTTSPYAESDPVLKPDKDYDNLGIGGCTVLRHATFWEMFYAGVNSAATTICYATSFDGINWIKDRDSLNNPIFTPSQDPIAINSLEKPTVVIIGDSLYFMYYGYKVTPDGIGLATAEVVSYSIAILSPNGGEVWSVGETEDITWISENVGDVKIELSVDNGTIWTSIVDSTPSTGTYSWEVTAQDSSDQCLIKVTDVLDGNINDVSDAVFTIGNIVSVKNNIEGIPTVYALEQNYPNPFNNSTVIKYSIPQEGLVTLKVYNLLGEEVAKLVNDTKLAGNYEASFDATGLPSGIYFYRLNAGDFIETKKMILLK